MGVEQTICLFIDAISQAQYRCLGSVGWVKILLHAGRLNDGPKNIEWTEPDSLPQTESLCGTSPIVCHITPALRNSYTIQVILDDRESSPPTTLTCSM